MKKLIFIFLVLITFIGNAQIIETIVPSGKYILRTLDNKSWVETFAYNVKVSSLKTPTVADTVYNVPIGMMVAEINTITRPVGKTMAIAVAPGWTGIGTIAIADDSIFFDRGEGVGADPHLKGTSTIAGFTLYSGNIYRVALASVPSQVFEDDNKVRISRFPNEGYIYIDEVNNAGLTIIASELDGIDWTGSTGIFMGVPWGFEAKTIQTSNGNTITIDNDVYGLVAGEPLFIVNHIDILDGASQWAHDGIYLYVWCSDGLNPSTHTIEVSTEDYGFIVDGRKNITIKNFNISGFSKDAIHLSGTCTDIIIAHNTFTDNYDCAVQAYDSELNQIDITNNVISGSNRSAIRMKGTDCTIAYDTISNHSLLENIGLTAYTDGYNTAMAILGYPFTNSTVANNNISNIAYNGIMFKGLGNVIEKNLVTTTCQVLFDGGGIYAHSDCTGSVIKDNIVWDNGLSILTSGVYGIYLDLTNKGLTVTRNTIYGNKGYGLMTNNPQQMTATYNTIYGNAQEAFFTNDYAGYESVFRGNNIKHNIFFSKTTTTPLYTELLIPTDSVDFITLDSNWYCNPYSTAGIPSAWEVNQFTLYDLFDTEIVTDTLSDDLVINGTFDTNTDNWYVSGWSASSPLGTGGAIAKYSTTGSTLIQSYNWNHAVTDSVRLMLNLDIVAKTLPSAFFYNLTISNADFGEPMFTSEVTHIKSFASYVGSLITARLYMGYTVASNDSIYIDNVSIYEVATIPADQESKSKLFVNKTDAAAKPNYLGSNWNNIYGNLIDTTATIEPFTSIIGILQD